MAQRPPRRAWRTALAGALVTALTPALLLVPSQPAGAVSPGPNGDIFVVSDADLNGEQAGYRIWRLRADGSGAHPITDSHPGLNFSPAVSPDGRFVVYLSERDGESGLYRMRTDGSHEVQLTDNQKPAPASDTFVPLRDETPSWSPDARHIVFTRYDHTSLQGHLYVMNADGTDEKQVGRIDGVDATFTPDGRRILFSSYESGGGIASVRTDGTGMRRLTRGHSDSRPVASPDGKHIVFTRAPDDDHSDVYRMNADGSGQTDLTHNPAIDGSATWSPDGRRVLFTSDRPSSRGPLWTMWPDGSHPKALVGTGRIDDSSAWASSPSTCLGRPVTISGTSRRDVLRGTPGPDVISGRGGNDRINGLGGNDVVCGGPGNDRLYGGAGRDRLSGGRGKDQMSGGAGRDRISS